MTSPCVLVLTERNVTAIRTSLVNGRIQTSWGNQYHERSQSHVFGANTCDVPMISSSGVEL